LKILVANLGSTSFKYRLFDVSDPAEPVLARGSIERIGGPMARVVVKSTRGERELDRPIADHGDAVQLCLDQLTDPEIGVLADPGDVAAIGFKAFLTSIRHYLGAFLLELGGADVIAFTGGIGENSARIRSGVCRDLGWFGIALDPRQNASGPAERRVSTSDSRVQVWTVPTNEELVVARQSQALLDSGKQSMM